MSKGIWKCPLLSSSSLSPGAKGESLSISGVYKVRNGVSHNQYTLLSNQHSCVCTVNVALVWSENHSLILSMTAMRDGSSRIPRLSSSFSSLAVPKHFIPRVSKSWMRAENEAKMAVLGHYTLLAHNRD